MMQINEEVTKMTIHLSSPKSNFVSNQADVILAQSNFASSASVQAESIRSLVSKVDALGVRLDSQSSSLESKDTSMGSIVSGINDFVTWIKYVMPKRGKWMH